MLVYKLHNSIIINALTLSTTYIYINKTKMFLLTCVFIRQPQINDDVAAMS